MLLKGLHRSAKSITYSEKEARMPCLMDERRMLLSELV
jgi:hypothetical protein